MNEGGTVNEINRIYRMRKRTNRAMIHPRVNLPTLQIYEIQQSNKKTKKNEQKN
jgi:hypothetical protein